MKEEIGPGTLAPKKSMNGTVAVQTRKNTYSLHNQNSIYFSYTNLFLAFTKEIAGKRKKFTHI